MQEPKSLSELLLEQLEQKNISAEKLSDNTGVPKRFIHAFIDPEYTDHHALPSAPYMRGYLKKIALTLDLNPENTWQTYERRHAPRQSGHKDYLPKNRFKIESINKKNIVIALLSTLLIIYISFNASRLFQ